MTACLIGLDKKDSEISFILIKTIDEISSEWNFLFSLKNLTTIIGLSSCPPTTLKGHNFQSFWTIVSLYFLPLSLLASKTVLTGFLATLFLAASPINLSVSVKAT